MKAKDFDKKFDEVRQKVTVQLDFEGNAGPLESTETRVIQLGLRTTGPAAPAFSAADVGNIAEIKEELTDSFKGLLAEALKESEVGAPEWGWEWWCS